MTRATPRTERQVTRILEAVSVRPMTTKQIAAHLNMSVSAVLIYTRLLMAAPRRLHIVDHLRPPNRGRSAPVYAAGNLPDAPFVPWPKLPKEQKPDRINLQRDRVLAAMAEPCTAAQLGMRVHLTQSRARFYIHELRQSKQAFICAWESPPGRGFPSPVYALGSKRDKKKPRKTRAQRYKEEMKDPERRERIQALRKTRENLAKLLRKTTHWASALGAA